MANSKGPIPVAAIVLIGLGVLFLAGQLGYIDVGAFAAQWWPALLIVIGLSQVVGGGGGWAAWLLVGAGVVMLAMSRGYLPKDIGRFWPVILIVAGLAILFGRGRRGK